MINSRMEKDQTLPPPPSYPKNYFGEGGGRACADPENFFGGGMVARVLYPGILLCEFEIFDPPF